MIPVKQKPSQLKRLTLDYLAAIGPALIGLYPSLVAACLSLSATLAKNLVLSFP